MFEVALATVHGKPTAIGSAGPFTLVVDRPAEAGDGGLGFSGGPDSVAAHSSTWLSAGCISNDLFGRRAKGIELSHVRVTTSGDTSG
jgi:putative redox protein